MKKPGNPWRCSLNETLRILRLLEQGKINAEEAARLLNALNPEHYTKRRKQRVWNVMGLIPEIISTTVAEKFKYTGSEQTRTFTQKNKIDLHAISGDIEISGADTRTININQSGLVKVNERNENLKIKAITGDLKITAPKKIDLEIKGVSGDIKITEINGKINLATISGDVRGKKLSGNFSGEIVSGDLELEYEDIENIMIHNKNGDITLYLSEDIEGSIEVYTDDGKIRCDFPLQKKQESKHSLKGIINRAKSSIEIRTAHGDIAIKNLQERKK